MVLDCGTSATASQSRRLQEIFSFIPSLFKTKILTPRHEVETLDR